MLDYNSKYGKRTLPYNPLSEGYRLHSIRDCCLVFRTSDDKIQVRVKKITHLVIIEEVDEEGEAGKILNGFSTPPKNIDEFKAIVNDFC